MQLKAFTVPPKDYIMKQGECSDELLILSRGEAKTEDKSDGGKATLYEVGTFWGEMQFLGLEKQRSLTVVGNTYCEIASLSPKCVDKLTYGTAFGNRLQAYADARQSIELAIAIGEQVDMDEIMWQLEEKYKKADADADDLAPPPPKRKAVGAEEGGQLSEVVMDTLYELQKAQRGTETQLASMMKLLGNMQAQLKEQDTGDPT